MLVGDARRRRRHGHPGTAVHTAHPARREALALDQEETMTTARATGPAPLPRAALDAVIDPRGSGCMLPREAYTSHEVLAWEREHLFSASWVCVGRAGELATAGDRTAVQVGDDSVVLVRGDDGELRGFFNVCRHRGHQLMPCGASARRTAIHCPYHGWTYALDGGLRATPRFDAPAGFDASAHGLVPVRVAEWHGWVMVNVSGDAPPLAQWIGGLDELVAPYGCGRLAVGASHEYVLHANWKLPIENYHECYHCPAIHPELCTVSPPTSGDNFELPGAWFGGTMDLEAHAETMSMSGKSGAEPLPGLNATLQRQVLYVGLFPNLLLSLHPDYVMTHRIEPRTPNESWVECQWLFAPEVMERDGFDPSYAVDFWDVTNRQDWNACEGVQRGVASRGYRPGPFSEAEDAVQGFTSFVARAYLEGAMPSPR
jgi:Rieske 2Fe-2S family protein